jgi:DNA relaxase NicK
MPSTFGFGCTCVNLKLSLTAKNKQTKSGRTYNVLYVTVCSRGARTCINVSLKGTGAGAAQRVIQLWRLLKVFQDINKISQII